MRVVPLKNFSGRWTFPTDRYENAQISMIDEEGNYIIRGADFTSPNFFGFYKASEQPASLKIDTIENEVHTTGSFHMLNPKGENRLPFYNVSRHQNADERNYWSYNNCRKECTRFFLRTG